MLALLCNSVNTTFGLIVHYWKQKCLDSSKWFQCGRKHFSPFLLFFHGLAPQNVHTRLQILNQQTTGCRLYHICHIIHCWSAASKSKVYLFFQIPCFCQDYSVGKKRKIFLFIVVIFIQLHHVLLVQHCLLDESTCFSLAESMTVFSPNYR